MSAIEAAFVGTLGRDGESKTSKNDRPYLRLNVRVGDAEAQWVSVMTFDPQAIAQADKFLKGTRLYVEGKLRLDQWAAQDGTQKHGLSCMSWHCRLAEIGRNKPQRDGNTTPRSESPNDDFQDQIGF